MMRGLLGLCVILTIVLPASQGAVNPVPILSISLDTPSQQANVTANSSAAVEFTGHCAVDKLPVERVVVQLTSSVDKGWNAQVAPSQMVFTSTTPQSFTCTVIVPAGTPNGTLGKLTISGSATATHLTSTTYTEALISVEAPAPVNQTGNATNGTKGNSGTNQTDNTAIATTRAPTLFGLTKDQLIMASGAVIVVVGIASVGVYVRARRKGRTLTVEPEQYQPL